MEKEELTSRFLDIGLSEKFIQGFVKNPGKASILYNILKEANIGQVGQSFGTLLLKLAENLKDTELSVSHRALVAQYILERRLNNAPQVEAAAKYLNTRSTFDARSFEEECGVGVVVTTDDIRNCVDRFVEEHKDELLKERYQFNVGASILQPVRAALKWADGKQVKDIVDQTILHVLGPKNEKDMEEAMKKKKKKGKEVDEVLEEKVEVLTTDFIDKKLKARDLRTAINPPQLIEYHNRMIDGRIRTRFPPEPNGFLHIGHAKAMNFSFGVAQKANGVTFLRFDDTNPTAEKQVYIDNIIENVLWLGHRPFQITYSSDYFDALYELAVELIKRGKAYVCHQSKEQIAACRKLKQKQLPSPWRDRSVEENLKMFASMRSGKFRESEATLRMKIDITHKNPTMWDPVAYRIKFEPHPHVGDKWCIYPSYDFTHCLVDSLEHISYSLCTLEFEIRRDLYYWILDALDMYRPKVWEYGRLNLTHGVLSKRKLKYLVDSNAVRGWDDPRLLTLNGLRRRGYSADAINNFCERIGVARSTNGFVKMQLLETCARYDLDESASRSMAILRPLKVRIVNWPGNETRRITVPNFPKDPSKGVHEVVLNEIVYIDQEDFHPHDDPNFFGLAPGKFVHLKYAYNIRCDSFASDDKGNIIELQCTIDFDNVVKVKGNLHWVSDAVPCEMRIYEHLFTPEFPGTKVEDASPDIVLEDMNVDVEHDDDEEEVDSKQEWLNDLNPNSECVFSGLCERSLLGCPPGTRFQFERVGYFVVDKDSSNDNLVFNRIVELKSGK